MLLSDLHKKVIDSVPRDGHGLLRKFLTSEEIKAANQLVKVGILEKGTSDDKYGSVAFFFVDIRYEY